jgi:hypothetical protein
MPANRLSEFPNAAINNAGIAASSTRFSGVR